MVARDFEPSHPKGASRAAALLRGSATARLVPSCHPPRTTDSLHAPTATTGETATTIVGLELADHHGQPRPSSEQPDYTLTCHEPHRYAGTDDGRGTDQTLDAKRLPLMIGRRPAAAFIARGSLLRPPKTMRWGRIQCLPLEVLAGALPYPHNRNSAEAGMKRRGEWFCGRKCWLAHWHLQGDRPRRISRASSLDRSHVRAAIRVCCRAW